MAPRWAKEEGRLEAEWAESRAAARRKSARSSTSSAAGMGIFRGGRTRGARRKSRGIERRSTADIANGDDTIEKKRKIVRSDKENDK